MNQPTLPYSSTKSGSTQRATSSTPFSTSAPVEAINDCVLEIFLSPFQQSRLPDSFWRLCQPTHSDPRWVTWLYPSDHIQSRLIQSRQDAHHSAFFKNTIDSFRMVRSQEAPPKSMYAALRHAITLATSRVVIIEMHHLKNLNNATSQQHLSLNHYKALNRVCDQNDCQLVILHSSVH